MYSKELEILDRNTVLYMIDEMKKQIKEKDLLIQQKELELARIQQIIKQNEILAQKEQEILELKSRLAALQEAKK